MLSLSTYFSTRRYNKLAAEGEVAGLFDELQQKIRQSEPLDQKYMAGITLIEQMFDIDQRLASLNKEMGLGYRRSLLR
jgi:hypothetical protein